MNTEIWLALIAAVVALASTIGLPIVLAWSKLKFVAETAEKSAKTAEKTAKKTDETHDLVNGHSMRMQEMYDLSIRQAEVLAATEKRLAVLEAYAKGKRDAEGGKTVEP